MTTDLRPYPAYTESELRWLERVPSHWDVVRAKCLFREIDERSSTGKEDLLSVSHIRGVTKRSETNATMFLAMSNKGHKICRPGDLVINTMWAWMGAIAVSPHTGLVSPSYGTYRPTGRNALLTEYAHQLLRTPQYVSEYISRSTGIHSSRLRLYPEQFLRIPVLCPPDEEQAAIVRFLNHATRRFADVIRAKKKLIALLNEQKQGIIHRIVTRGLDSKVRLIPSGILWLGEIPEHWGTRPLKRCTTVISKGTTPSTEGRDLLAEGPVRFVKGENIARGSISEVPRAFIDQATHALLQRSQLRENDVLFVIAGTLGKVAVVGSQHVPANTSQAVAFIRPNTKEVMPDFLAAWLQSARIQDQTWLNAVQSAQPNLSMESLGLFPVPLPPISEQALIVQRLNQELSGLILALVGAQKEIDLIREFRTRLISDVVTGQLDVREAAIGLTVEVEEAEVVTEAEAEDETEGLVEAVRDNECN